MIAVAAVLVAPLAAYVFLIALLGLPHVLCELRYCDERFSARAPRAALVAIGALLAGLAGLRVAQGFGALPAGTAIPAELGLGIALAAVGVWFMPRRRLLGAAIGGTLAAGTVFAPVMTFLVIAWLHNLTPLGFVSEILPRHKRMRAIVLLLIPFLLVPAVVASGLPQRAIETWFGYSAIAAPSLFHAGRYPLVAFLPPTMHFETALPLFGAAVTAQAMHYLSVIAVMPLLLRRQQIKMISPSLWEGEGGGMAKNSVHVATPDPRITSRAGSNPPPEGERIRTVLSVVPWPRWRVFYIAVAALALAIFAGHAIDYPNARAFYSVAAAIHSWVELPIFLIALGFGFTASPSAPGR
ncbi:MAG: hypothetical protein U1E87_06105 [Alphaproteobacteria bacterium]